MDTLSASERSQLMAKVRSQDTGPELLVRRLVHSLGYRFRLYRRDLPGVPDLVFPGRRCVIFVHGCFWHQHDCSAGNRIPKTRATFWTEKLSKNVARDRRQNSQLRRLGWRVLVIWECQTRSASLDRLADRIARFLDR